jgi:hypothetical protein
MPAHEPHLAPSSPGRRASIGARPAFCRLTSHPQDSQPSNNNQGSKQNEATVNLDGKRIIVAFNLNGPYTLSWGDFNAEVDGRNVTVLHGSSILYQYPRITTSKVQLSTLQAKAVSRLLVALSAQQEELVRSNEDMFGTKLLIGLLISNTDASVELGRDLIEQDPQLLLRVCSDSATDKKGPYAGEGPLHVALVNQRKKLARHMMRVAAKAAQTGEFRQDDILELVTQKCEGSYFHQAPQCCARAS